jgi:outer membrane receptor protein involved in Fe transport
MKKETLEKRTKIANDIMYYIYTHIETNIDIEELSIDLDISKFHMHRVFKEIFGRNIYESIKSIRLQKASNLLLTNRYSTISSIVNSCGYSSQSSFIKIFKDRFGMSPKEWKNGGYANLNFKPNKSWDILAGIRAENNITITRYKLITDNINGSFRNITKNQNYFLPSLSVKKALNNKSNLRLAISKTITRPILIETMPIEYINPDNNTILGNYNIPNTSFGKDFKGLDNSQNYNFDLKYEIFPKSSEIFAVNFFGKIVDRAIERSLISSSNSNGTTTTFFNAKQAKLAGVELEGSFNLGRISENLNRLNMGANFTYIYSDVEKSDAQKSETNFSKKRGLQGAAPWMLNVDLKYDFKNAKNLKRTASLVYNTSAEKIYAVGFGGLDHVYEQPFHQLDFIFQSELSKKVDVKLGVYNILNQTYKLKMGDESTVNISTPNLLLEDYKKGISYNLSFGIKF